MPNKRNFATTFSAFAMILFSCPNYVCSQTFNYDPASQELFVEATAGDDEIWAIGTGVQGEVIVAVNSQVMEFRDVLQLEIDGLDGNDTFHAMGTIVLDTSSYLGFMTLRGGEGNDKFLVEAGLIGNLFLLDASGAIPHTASGTDGVEVINSSFSGHILIDLKGEANDIAIDNVRVALTTNIISYSQASNTVILSNLQTQNLLLSASEDATVDLSLQSVTVAGSTIVGGAAWNPDAQDITFSGIDCDFNQFKFTGGSATATLDLMNCVVGDPSLTDPIEILTFEGSDEIYIEETEFLQSVSVVTNGGGDVIRFNRRNSVSGDLEIESGTGVDTIALVERINLAGNLSIHTASHNDFVSVTNAKVLGNVSIETGSGHDRLTWTSSTTVGSWEARMGSGVDRVYIEFADFVGAFYANGGTWFDIGNEFDNNFFGSMSSDFFESGNL